MSKTELCERARVSRQTIYNWEHGTTDPFPKQLSRVAKTLEIEPQDLREAFHETCRRAGVAPRR